MSSRERAAAKSRDAEYKVAALTAYTAGMSAMKANNERGEKAPMARRKNDLARSGAEAMMATREVTGARDAARAARQLAQDDAIANEVRACWRGGGARAGWAAWGEGGGCGCGCGACGRGGCTAASAAPRA